MATDPNIEIGQ